MKKIFLITLLIATCISCSTVPTQFEITDFKEGDKNYSFVLTSNKIPEAGSMVTVNLNSFQIYSQSLSDTFVDTITVELFKLDDKIRKQIAQLFVDNTNVNLTVKIFDRKFTELVKIEFNVSNPVNNALKYMEFDFSGHHVYNWANLEKDSIIATVMKMIHPNIIEIPFQEDIPIFSKKDNINLTLKYPNGLKLDISFNRKGLKSTIQKSESEGFTVAECNIKISDNFKGTIYCELKNLETNVEYGIRVAFIDRYPPTITSPYIQQESIGSQSSEFVKITPERFKELNQDIFPYLSDSDKPGPYGKIKITHGDWQSEGYYSPITFEVFVSGDVEKVFFDNKPMNFTKGKTKYVTLNLVTHVGKNAFEVVAFDKFGNRATEDYVISAKSVKD